MTTSMLNICGCVLCVRHCTRLWKYKNAYKQISFQVVYCLVDKENMKWPSIDYSMQCYDI